MSDTESDVMRPGADAEAQPYWAIMSAGDDGLADGNIWSFGGNLMLFFDSELGEKLMSNLASAGGASYVLRGVTEAHLAKLQQLSEQSGVGLYVVLRIQGSNIEAIPLQEHLAELPPDLPPPSS